jgi:sugar lactone lactonase YvrE
MSNDSLIDPHSSVEADLAQLMLAQNATLGEGLQWHAPTQRWWWTDIEASTLNAWTPGAAQTLTAKLPDRLGSFAHCRSGRLLLGLAKRLCLATLVDAQANGSVSPAIQSLVPVDPAEPRTRINDGRTDRRGYFVFGTMNQASDKRPIGSFYQYSMQHGLRRLALPAVAIANSICFSPDGGTMYFCDTLSQTIMQCDYDAESAQVARVRPFAQVEPAHAWPDGSVIASDASLWNAQWGAGRVVQYSPEGQVMRVVRVAANNTTCPAFGGEMMDELMVTSARVDQSREELERLPGSGSLFGLRLPLVRGLPDALFDDQPAGA